MNVPNPEEEPDAARALLARQPAFSMFALFLLCTVTIAAALQLANLPFGVIFSEIFFFAGPVVLWTRASGLARPVVLHLRLPRAPLIPLGLLIGARMRSQQGFQIVMQLVIFPMMFLSGIFFPISGVATWLEVLSKLNPVTYGIDAIRQVFLGSEVAGVTVFGHTMGILDSALVVAVVGVVLLAAAIWSFNQQE